MLIHVKTVKIINVTHCCPEIAKSERECFSYERQANAFEVLTLAPPITLVFRAPPERALSLWFDLSVELLFKYPQP